MSNVSYVGSCRLTCASGRQPPPLHGTRARSSRVRSLESSFGLVSARTLGEARGVWSLGMKTRDDSKQLGHSDSTSTQRRRMTADRRLFVQFGKGSRKQAAGRTRELIVAEVLFQVSINLSPVWALVFPAQPIIGCPESRIRPFYPPESLSGQCSTAREWDDWDGQAHALSVGKRHN